MPFIGIATHEQVNRHGQPISPHWTIVLSNTPHFNDEVHCYHIVNQDPGWSKPPVRVRLLQDSPTIIGIVLVAHVAQPMPELDAYFAAAPLCYRQDRSGLFMWSCESWVINALSVLADAQPGLLPVRAEHVYERVHARIEEMRRLKRQSSSSRLVVTNL
ncbi:hypothetical protein FISHEDRAFT_56240 [Fistulina hepatica ATCC 64428]|uniref:Uncharacterized protein n=1 Tax=Fistulina hepatica ATCC 64428 TaxID=1128425 RepID=A0A0D7AK80_9AGAR|nr:hypothetical protein FISHEDRAFT_56240 [Fistulina hepatica ATCC 64428]